MNRHEFIHTGTRLSALATGALWWPQHHLLCVSDLHLGKSKRMARRGGRALPPYETQDTLARLAIDLTQTAATTVVCLGDSFDDLEAARTLPEADLLRIKQLQVGRRWVWIEGNHDPGPVNLNGDHCSEKSFKPLIFRHIAQAEGATGEITGHYHPKASVIARGRKITRSAFLIDSDRIVMPAYGTYTGGLDSKSKVLTHLMKPGAIAVLTGKNPAVIPMPR